MEYTGNIRKMKVQLDDGVQYQFVIGEEHVPMNPLVGKDIHLHYTGTINCKICGRKTKKSFSQGCCYPCFQNAPENSPCIIKPELCEAHLGKGRDVEWENTHHNQQHVVYLALTSIVKIGVTRHDQVPTRWIDQGAWKAIKVSEVPYRYLAGKIEVFLKDHFADKTNWRHMLQNILAEEVDLLAEKQKVFDLLPEELSQYNSTDDTIWELKYPVQEYPVKVKSLNLDKDPDVKGTLLGIKGQYLLFDGGRVINMRKYAGYELVLSY